jgi:hypothetical protein
MTGSDSGVASTGAPGRLLARRSARHLGAGSAVLGPDDGPTDLQAPLLQHHGRRGADAPVRVGPRVPGLVARRTEKCGSEVGRLAVGTDRWRGAVQDQARCSRPGHLRSRGGKPGSARGAGDRPRTATSPSLLSAPVSLVNGTPRDFRGAPLGDAAVLVFVLNVTSLSLLLVCVGGFAPSRHLPSDPGVPAHLPGERILRSLDVSATFRGSELDGHRANARWS